MLFSHAQPKNFKFLIDILMLVILKLATFEPIQKHHFKTKIVNEEFRRKLQRERTKLTFMKIILHFKLIKNI